jgi:hypothetical protein
MDPFTISRTISALASSREIGAGCKWSLLAKLDRLAIGSILRSKLVFLVNVRLLALHSSRVQVFEGFGLRDEGSGIHSAECVDIDNESNQVP